MTIMITLNQIRAASPSEEGLSKFLKSYKQIGMDTPFPLSSVLESNDLSDTLWCFKALPVSKTLAQFSLWCTQQVESLIVNQGSIDALNVARQYINGNATIKDVKDMESIALDSLVYFGCMSYNPEYYPAAAVLNTICTICDPNFDFLHAAATATRCCDAAASVGDYDMQQRQIDKLREMLNA